MSEAPMQVLNGHGFDAADCPVAEFGEFRRIVVGRVRDGARICALFGQAAGAGGRGVRLVCVLADDENAQLWVLATEAGGEFESLTPDCAQAHWFEREIAENWGVTPVGHPWLKPIRFKQAGSEVGVTGFFQTAGDEAHEVAVGPVHAGVIEPGHFRFQCVGETVKHLEISLGYQHRGVERAIASGPARRAVHYVQTLAGDTTIGHTTAYCRTVEALSSIRVPARAQAIRGIAAELERLANHIGDLGAMAGDVGFLPTMSYCGRIRGDVLNLTATLCGNRFGRGLVIPGGVAWDLDEARAGQMRERLAGVARDVRSSVGLMFDAPSVTARLDDTGQVAAETAIAIGLVGPAARASGLDLDVRAQFPYGIYRFASLPVSTWHTGDCFARAYVRWLEVQHSLAFLAEQLHALPAGPIASDAPAAFAANRMVVALVEGWRGEICHVATTSAAGRFALPGGGYKIVDPSFHNWFGLALALRGQQISDFPLCNKSFNLSYCGHDL
ncbi:MAG: NADH-quinone oxidoreductase subunit C [Phycisphaerae bacterium]|nr:NADH-quinone oxidoreductase subunit C [Phycisphaerae bacterium]